MVYELNLPSYCRFLYSLSFFPVIKVNLSYFKDYCIDPLQVSIAYLKGSYFAVAVSVVLFMSTN